MSEPEIARRCAHCGVSLRQRALFCPQCGHRTDEPGPVDASPTAATQALHPGPVDATPVAPTQALHPAPAHHQPGGLTGVADNVRDRVEKIKHVSSVMIDQAAYDPSLRFLLVAAALFVVFLVLLILSKVIG